MDQLTVTEHDSRLNLWIQRIKECRESDMTVDAWCKSNEINVKTYYYWLRKIKKEAFEALPQKCKQVPSPFVERKVFSEVHTLEPTYAENVAATVDIAGIRIDVHNGADNVTLQNIIRIISAYVG